MHFPLVEQEFHENMSLSVTVEDHLEVGCHGGVEEVLPVETNVLQAAYGRTALSDAHSGEEFQQLGVVSET